MNRFVTRRVAVIAALAVGIGAVGGGAALAGGGDDDATETPISGSALERAKAAALDHAGQGTVTGTEVGDEESYYEVEVTLANGSQVDVQLDESFNVVGSEGDRDGSGED
jgi:Peptidase propeptide and YPEB domain